MKIEDFWAAYCGQMKEKLIYLSLIASSEFGIVIQRHTGISV